MKQLMHERMTPEHCMSSVSLFPSEYATASRAPWQGFGACTVHEYVTASFLKLPIVGTCRKRAETTVSFRSAEGFARGFRWGRVPVFT